MPELIPARAAIAIACVHCHHPAAYLNAPAVDDSLTPMIGGMLSMLTRGRITAMPTSGGELIFGLQPAELAELLHLTCPSCEAKEGSRDPH